MKMEEIKFADSSWSHYTKDNKLIFIPNVSKQRYSRVHDLLTHVKWKDKIGSVTEFGCASFKFFPYLKNTLEVQNINFVDIDDYLMQDNLFYIRPLLYDRLNKRNKPLEVKVYKGSISAPDSRILNSDAVIGIEVIEHLFPDTLEAVPYAIFHRIRPKIVIFTTPNADFNVALPNFKKFRHPDHKFEWTREQFESWASNITVRFPQYKSLFFGVGKGPKGTSSLGFCSQLCLFIRKDIINLQYDTHSSCYCEEAMINNGCTENLKCLECYPLEPFGICTYLTKSKEFQSTGEDQNFYKLIEAIVYPCEEKVKQTKEEHILESLQLKIYNDFLQFTNEDGVEEIPLYSISRNYEDQKVTEEEIRNVLILHGYEIKDCLVKNCNGQGNHDWAPCVLYKRPETPSTESSSCEEENERLSPENSQSDWD